MPTDTGTDTETPAASAPKGRARQSHLLARRTCGVCGSALPAYDGPRGGRPAQYCTPESGRPCRVVVKTYAALRAQIEAIAVGVDPIARERFLHAQRLTLRSLSQDLTRTVAQLQGDHERDLAVGGRDPGGFFGD